MKKISKGKLQDYINRLSGKPKLWKRFKNIYHINDLSNFDFSRLDFSDKNFSYFDFSNMNFNFVNFYSANFNSARFNYASFYYARFNSANFDYTNFNYTNFYYTNFYYTNFDSASFNSANFNSANFDYANFYSASFDSASFDSASFDSANFDSANFDYANFNYTNFDSANFDSASFDYKFLKKLVSLRIKMKYLNFLDINGYYIGYKVFGEFYKPNSKWRIKEKSIIREKYVDNNLYRNCGPGINIGNKKWILENTSSDEIWVVAIDKGDEIIVSYESNGKIRVNRCKLLKKITRKQLQNMSDDDILDLVKEDKK